MIDQFQTSDIKFVPGKQTGKSLAKTLWIQDKQGRPIYLQLSNEPLMIPFGASPEYGKTVEESKRRVLDINLTPKIKDKVGELEDFIQDHVKTLKWVKKSANFASVIKERDGYADKLRCKFSIGEISITKVAVDGIKTPASIEDITRGSSARVIIQLKCLYQAGGRYGLSIAVKAIQIRERVPEQINFLELS
jgi:hypothetical protein